MARRLDAIDTWLDAAEAGSRFTTFVLRLDLSVLFRNFKRCFGVLKIVFIIVGIETSTKIKHTVSI